jgi:hypothetical protein
MFQCGGGTRPVDRALRWRAALSKLSYTSKNAILSIARDCIIPVYPDPGRWMQAVSSETEHSVRSLGVCPGIDTEKLGSDGVCEVAEGHAGRASGWFSNQSFSIRSIIWAI